MKWIKTFEELTPKIYRDAGQRFINIPHKVEKGKKLKDYGSEKEWGVYNIELVKNYDNITRGIKFTKPRAKFILNKKKPGSNVISDINTRYENISVEDMLDLWNDGERDLYFTIEFYFEPLEETKSNIGRSLPAWGDLPLFSFRVNLSTWDDGLKTWNNPEDWDDEENENPPKEYSLQELYDECNELNISLDLPQANPRSVYTGQRMADIYHYGIFSDRNSAFKFKKALPTLINDEVIEEIWEIFSLLGDSKNFQRCIHALKYGIKVNLLYDDIRSLSDTRNPRSKWFYHNIAVIPREVPKKETREEVKEEQPEESNPFWYQSRT